ncbi:diacylglycerol/lipid kinase family protein [Mangrovivirga cuniculi]|uniref:Diacylglycerol kinase n=1 Tax=Mangrovivirga cuniculi TaxID=2715131 RepID=A0A4D7JRH6_9BACT|nr:diacylglycerol kinase family protein [Mangrovivirga cuniculi]QCK14366.1 diacylglycerol kinase [Mangrovivirga cuniculi]
MNSTWIILNPNAGTKDKTLIPDIEAKAKFIRKSPGQNLFKTQHPGHASEITKKAIKQGVEKIIAVGGDGTVNEIARELVHSKTALAIIPAGSGNGLARQLNIPMNRQKAWEVAVNLEKTAIDSLEINGEAFFCTAGFGFDAFVTHEFHNMPERGLMSYAKASVGSYFKFPDQNFEILLAGKDRIIVDAIGITIANAGQYGNNAWISPLSDIRDGKAELVILKKMPSYLLPGFLYKLFQKKLIPDNYYSTIELPKTFTIKTDCNFLHVDGEVIPLEKGYKTYKVKILPKSLNIIPGKI